MLLERRSSMLPDTESSGSGIMTCLSTPTPCSKPSRWRFRTLTLPLSLEGRGDRKGQKVTANLHLTRGEVTEIEMETP